MGLCVWSCILLYDVCLYGSGVSDCEMCVGGVFWGWYVYMCVCVGGSNEFQPWGSVFRLPAGWVLPAYCRRTPLPVSRGGSTQSSAQCHQWPPWTNEVSNTHTHTLLWLPLQFWLSFSVMTLCCRDWGRKQLKREPFLCAGASSTTTASY